MICVVSLGLTSNAQDFRNVSVHDPSVMRAADGMYYIVGSHMAGAKTADLMNWEQLSRSVNDQKFFTDIRAELGSIMDWANTRTFWAGSFIQLKNGKYMMNYCVCQGSCPQAVLGYALADNPEGPYKDMGILLRSFGSRGTWEDQEVLNALRAGERGDETVMATIDMEDGKTLKYNSNLMPNAIDPCVFYDKNGCLWLLYGSYSGGIFILELNEDGTIKEGQEYYGKRLMGNYHCRFEGPFTIYSPKTEYYYMFLSFGGLSARAGYNIRVVRSKTPDGEYYDAKGYKMTDCKGVPGQTLNRQDRVIDKYGVKLMGNFVFRPYGDETNASEVYRSPGHNSAYYNPETDQYFLIFHTRFEGSGDSHQVRVHEMFTNEDGWLVVAPHRYTGKLEGNYQKSEYVGTYKMVNHGTSITPNLVESQLIELNDDNTITGAITGTWSINSDNNRMVTMNANGEIYKGMFHYQKDPANDKNKMTFSICGMSCNECIWGSKAK